MPKNSKCSYSEDIKKETQEFINNKDKKILKF